MQAVQAAIVCVWGSLCASVMGPLVRLLAWFTWSCVLVWGSSSAVGIGSCAVGSRELLKGRFQPQKVSEASCGNLIGEAKEERKQRHGTRNLPFFVLGLPVRNRQYVPEHEHHDGLWPRGCFQLFPGQVVFDMLQAPVRLVAAVARNGVIGQAGQLPWKLPKDRKWFEDLVRNNVMILGRRSFEETGRPIPGVVHTVLVSSSSTRGSGPSGDVEVCRTVDGNCGAHKIRFCTTTCCPSRNALRTSSFSAPWNGVEHALEDDFFGSGTCFTALVVRAAWSLRCPRAGPEGGNSAGLRRVCGWRCSDLPGDCPLRSRTRCHPRSRGLQR